MAALPILPTAAAALTAAGSAKLSPKARQELDNRIALFGCPEAAHNPGGIGCTIPGHAHGKDGLCLKWRNRWIEVFPDWATGARRAIRLARLATGETATRPTNETAGFTSVAPEAGQPPLEISHVSGAATEDERAALLSLLAGHLGSEEKARADVRDWKRASPAQRAKLRAKVRAEVGTGGNGEPDSIALFDALAGTSEENETGFAPRKGRAARHPRAAAARPTAAAVLRAQQAAAAARAQTRAAQARAAQARAEADALQAQLDAAQLAPAHDPGQLAPEPDAAQLDAALLAAQQLAAQTLDAAPTPTAETVEALTARLAAAVLARDQAIEAERASLDSMQGAEHKAGELAGLFGPSDATAHAFQDAAAAWKALDAAPDAKKLPGYEASRKDWEAFSKAFLAGDNRAAVCNGGAPPEQQDQSVFDAPACEAGLSSRLNDLERLKKDLATKAPEWAAKIPIPAPVTLAQAFPGATWAETAIVAPLRKIPGMDFITDPAKGLLSLKAPKSHYAAAAAAVLAALGVVTGGAVAIHRATTPRRRSAS